MAPLPGNFENLIASYHRKNLIGYVLISGNSKSKFFTKNNEVNVSPLDRRNSAWLSFHPFFPSSIACLNIKKGLCKLTQIYKAILSLTTILNLQILHNISPTLQSSVHGKLLNRLPN